MEKKKIENRIAVLIDFINTQENEASNYTIGSFKYYQNLDRISRYRSEKQMLESIYEKEYKLSVNKKTRIHKMSSYKEREQETIFDILKLTSENVDKVRVRRLINGLLNHRTDMVSSLVKNKTGEDLNFDKIKINIKTGQYGL